MTADELAKGVANAFYTERRHWVIRGSKTNPGVTVVARVDDVGAAHGLGVEHYEGEDCAITYEKLVGAACGAAALQFLAVNGIEAVKPALDAFVAAEAERVRTIHAYNDELRHQRDRGIIAPKIRPEEEAKDAAHTAFWAAQKHLLAVAAAYGAPVAPATPGRAGQNWGVIIDEMLGAMARAAVLDDDSKRDQGEAHKRCIDRVQALRGALLAQLTGSSPVDFVQG